MINLFSTAKFRIFWISLFWVILAILLFLTLTPSPFDPVNIQQIDKIFHLLAFCGFSFVFKVAFSKINHWTIIGISSAIGIGIEFIQYFIPNRGFSVADMIADVIGILIGTWVAYRVTQYNGNKLSQNQQI